MPSASFFVEPLSAAGHTSFRMESGTFAPFSTSPPLFGDRLAITLQEFAMFLRFELDLPADAVVESVKVQIISEARLGGVGDVMAGFEAGFLAIDERWELATGFSGYPSRDSLPLPERGLGMGRDLTVYHGGAPAFSGLTYPLHDPPSASGFDLSFGDAITAPRLAVTGLSQQLQSYLAVHEFLRGSSKPNSIPVGLVVLDHWTGASTNQSHEAVKNTVFDPAYQGASLEVTWAVPDPVSARGRVAINRGTRARSEILR